MLELHEVALIHLDEIDEKIKITVEPMVGHIHYFAISHALADGLCSSERNELPECQLRRILRSIRSAMCFEGLPQGLPVYVWIDTMCLPPRSSPFDGVATSTVQTIQVVMRNALAVVALDTDIAVLSQTSTYAECFLRISFSSWGSRLWTLLEAIIARKLLFECRDGVMEFEDFLEPPMNAPTMRNGPDWRPSLYARMGNSGKRHRDGRLLLDHALKWGRTSVESDTTRLKSTIVDLYRLLYIISSQQLLEPKDNDVIDAPRMAAVCGSPWAAL
ncbi:hypothetical protein E8E14_005713 [Neopestalotiopsis sp. 37M]|nr:hypothetical protein E8E14_005713 [Neopestalotiopsis sp. 37M]